MSEGPEEPDGRGIIPSEGRDEGQRYRPTKDSESALTQRCQSLDPKWLQLALFPLIDPVPPPKGLLGAPIPSDSQVARQL